MTSYFKKLLFGIQYSTRTGEQRIPNTAFDFVKIAFYPLYEKCDREPSGVNGYPGHPVHSKRTNRKRTLSIISARKSLLTAAEVRCARTQTSFRSRSVAPTLLRRQPVETLMRNKSFGLKPSSVLFVYLFI